MKRRPRIMLSAGEASGDMHGGHLVAELKRRGAETFGLGGPAMKKAGMRLDMDLTGRSVIGFVHVLMNLGYFWRAMRFAEALLKREKPDVLVVIDNPGFNLRLAARAKAMGIKVCGYISPQVWAWKAGRVAQMKRDLAKMLVTFPFEETIYQRQGLACEFVGNPLVDAVRPKMSRSSARRRLGAGSGQKIVGLLPGSRSQEVRWLLPVMVGASRALWARDPKLRFALLRAPKLGDEVYASALNSGLPISVLDAEAEKDVYGLRRAFDSAMVSSGTATLETALLGTPLLLMYRVHAWEYAIGRMLVKLPYIGLPNIVAGRKIVPEFIQGALKPEAIAAAMWGLLKFDLEAARQKKALKQAVVSLGKPGVAGRTARAVLALAEEA